MSPDAGYPSLDAAREHVRGALGRGEYLEAYDRSEVACAQFPDDLRLRYLGVLALAAAGAGQRAAQLLEPLVDAARERADLPADLAEDVAALDARLTKDQALASGLASDARRAAEKYEAIYRRLGRPYTCVNAATMWLLAGDHEHAMALSHAARRLVEATRDTAPEGERYWLEATDAEAALLLRDDAEVEAALRRAAEYVDGDLSSAATTRRQLALVCDRLGCDPSVLSLLPTPRVVHYCGHMISAPGARGRFPAEAEPEVAAAVRQAVQDVEFAFGSLACGADILFAEALLDVGAELHVHLPCTSEDFVVASVDGGGPGWRERFDHCLARATTVTITTQGGFRGEAELFDYCARVAMGHALIRADFLATEAEQIAVWDGRPPIGPAGTARDIATWARTGRPMFVIPVSGGVAPERSRALDPFRTVRAMLFADIQGFSRLDDQQIATFLEVVMRPIADALEPFRDSIRFRNTWGDGIYLVLDDAASAAACALAMQDTIEHLDLKGAGLPTDLTLRIAAHAGPVLERIDPVLGTPGVWGVEVTRAARMEPRTPPGAVYVTDQFAALLALEPDAVGRGQYVGRLPSAKDYGTFPMYVLTPRPPAATTRSPLPTPTIAADAASPEPAAPGATAPAAPEPTAPAVD